MVDYRTEVISDPLRVVNPDYRHLDGQVRSATGKLTRRLANFAAMTLKEPIEPKHVEPFLRRKAVLLGGCCPAGGAAVDRHPGGGLVWRMVPAAA